MKHIVICLICTVLLFAYIGQQTMGADSLAAAPTGNTVARVAAAVTNQVPKDAAAPRTVSQQQVGILLGHADALGTARFRSAFEKSMTADTKVNAVDTAGSIETKRTMFDKMLESQYNLIVLELLDTDDATYFIDGAGNAAIPLLIIGTQPAQELLTRYPGIYYIGFSGNSLVQLLAQETFAFWQSNPSLMNFEKDEWDLSYSAITTNGFEQSGYRKMFDEALQQLGVSTQFEVDSLVRHFDYDLYKEIDQTIIKDSELVIYDSSTEVQKAINYYYDPTEFKKRPKQQLALSVIDDGAIKLVEEGEVLFACGTDTKELGNRAARMAQVLMAGQTPSFQNLELELTGERSFFLPYTVIRSDIAPEPVEDEATAQ